MLLIRKERHELGIMTADYYNHLIAPMDDMYDEGIIPLCDFFQIENEKGVCGFFATNEENAILQFYLKESIREFSSSIFESIIAQNKIKKALGCSNDPLFYEQCIRKAIKITNHDFMFREKENEDSITIIPFEGIVMSRPDLEKLEEILKYFEGIGMIGEWLNSYLTQRIETCSILLFHYEGSIIGTGEVRPSSSFKGYANVGMTVSTDYRRRGLGAYILSTIKSLANESGLKAICSTDNANVASYNTILRSGFIPYHRIEEISF